MKDRYIMLNSNDKYTRWQKYSSVLIPMVFMLSISCLFVVLLILRVDVVADLFEKYFLLRLFFATPIGGGILVALIFLWSGKEVPIPEDAIIETLPQYFKRIGIFDEDSEQSANVSQPFELNISNGEKTLVISDVKKLFQEKDKYMVETKDNKVYHIGDVNNFEVTLLKTK